MEFSKILPANLDQNLIMGVCIVLFQKLYTFLRKKVPTRQENIQHEIFEVLKIFQNNLKFTRADC